MWDTSQPNGQRRAMLDTGRAWRESGFRVAAGCKGESWQTIAWHRQRPEAEASTWRGIPVEPMRCPATPRR
jgi:hypothetical protein